MNTRFNTYQTEICKTNSTSSERCVKCFSESKYRFLYQHFQAGESCSDHYLRYDSMIIVMSGQIELTIDDYTCLLITGDIMVLPLYSVVSFKSLTAVDVLSFTFMLDTYHYCMRKKLEGSINHHPIDKAHPSIPIKTTPAVNAFIESLKLMLDIMPDCHLLYKNKCFEFGMYLAACYDKDELVNLFYPLFRNDYEFLFGMNVEIENFESVVDTARNFGMDLDTFEERFQNVFNQSADEWFEKQRKHLIKQYVSTFPCAPNELVARFAFCSLDHLDSFCKYHYQKNTEQFIEEMRRQEAQRFLF